MNRQTLAGKRLFLGLIVALITYTQCAPQRALAQEEGKGPAELSTPLNSEGGNGLKINNRGLILLNFSDGVKMLLPLQNQSSNLPARELESPSFAEFRGGPSFMDSVRRVAGRTLKLSQDAVIVRETPPAAQSQVNVSSTKGEWKAAISRRFQSLNQRVQDLREKWSAKGSASQLVDGTSGAAGGDANDDKKDSVSPVSANGQTAGNFAPRFLTDIGGDQNRKKRFLTAYGLNAGLVAAVVTASIIGGHVVKQVAKHEVVTLFTPDKSTYMPLSNKRNDTTGGGGGGGDRDKLKAPKGKLPKLAMEQITPPAMVVRNDHPKLSAEPTVVVPPQVHLAANNMPNFGDPKAVIPAGPPSNGTGSGGGIGSGSGGGVGSGTGPGVGPGRGGGIGGGVFRVGGGVSAPEAIYTPDPEYSEEARKAKYQGTVVLWLIVDANGHPQALKVARSLGMGLDQKAIEAVRQWKFKPAMKGGQPVSVQINVEVNFRLY